MQYCRHHFQDSVILRGEKATFNFCAMLHQDMVTRWQPPLHGAKLQKEKEFPSACCTMKPIYG